MKTAMCRICLAKNVRTNSIVNTDLQHVYETLTNRLLEAGARPLVACYICYAQLQHCYQLSVRCLKAEEILTKIINGDQDCYDENNLVNPGKLLSLTPITHITSTSNVFTSGRQSYSTLVKEEPVSEDDDNEEINPKEVEDKYKLRCREETESSPEPDLSESTSQVDQEHYQTTCRSSEDELPLASHSHIQKLDTNNKTGHIRKDKTASQKLMPYKVVLTLEKGKSVLTSVPHSWEKDGILSWPRKNKNELIKQRGDPKDDWETLNCVVKRKNILTFEDAEAEIDRMCEYSDDDEMPAKQRLKKKKGKISISSTQPDFNDQAQECVKNIGNQTRFEKRITESHKNDESTSSVLLPSTSLLGADSSEIISKPLEVPVNIASVDFPNISKNVIHSDSFFVDINNLNEDVHETQADDAPTRVQETHNLTTKTDDLSAMLQSILDNQRILSDNQQNITMELAKLNVRFEELIKRFLTRDGQVENKLDFTAIAKIEDLEDLENKLKNMKYKTELEKKFSVVCKQHGKGLNTAYKLVDLIFKRDFIKQCSWAGGSRGEEKKICFKAFQRTIDLFFNMVKATDDLFTLEDCETFFKNILRNSKKRCLATNTKQSATKNRPKKLKKNTNNTNEPEQSNENITIRDTVDDNIKEEERGFTKPV